MQEEIDDPQVPLLSQEQTLETFEAEEIYPAS